MAWPFIETIRSAFSKCFNRKKSTPNPDEDEEELVSIKPKTTDTVFAVCKVGATAGGAVFIGFHSANYIYNTDEGHKTYLGMGLASWNFFWSLMSNIPNRYFNARRPVRKERHITKEQLEEYICAQPLDLPPPLKVLIAAYAYETPEIPATFFHPGRSKDRTEEVSFRQKTCYFLQSCTTALYSGFSILSGYQSKESLVKLIQILLHFMTLQRASQYNEECGKPLSELYVILLVNSLSVLMAEANRRSFNKSNKPWIRKNYRELFIDGKWRDIGLGTLLETLIGVSIATIISYFSGLKLMHSIRDNIVCQTGSELSNWIYKIVAGIGSWTTFSINGILLALPANHLRKISQNASSGSNWYRWLIPTIPASINKHLQNVPEWQSLHKYLFMPAMFIDGGLTLGVQAAFLSIATLGETVADRKDLNYNLYMMMAAAIGAIICARGGISAQSFSYNKELEYRANKAIKRKDAQLLKAVSISNLAALEDVKITQSNEEAATTIPYELMQDEHETQRSQLKQGEPNGNFSALTDPARIISRLAQERSQNMSKNAASSQNKTLTVDTTEEQRQPLLSRSRERDPVTTESVTKGASKGTAYLSSPSHCHTLYQPEFHNDDDKAPIPSKIRENALLTVV